MPPKKDPEAAPADNPYNLSNDEMRFLVDCLLHPAGGGTIAIDTKAVAAARGQKNAGSIYNRISALKKKYNIPISGCGGSSRKLAVDPTGPVISSKNKVMKFRAKTSKKGKAAKDVSDSAEEEMKVKSDSEGDEENDEENDEEDEMADEE